jgi:hypothetical protein
VVIGHNLLGETLPRHFVLICGTGIQADRFLFEFESTRKNAVLSLLPYLDIWVAAGYLLLLTGVYRGQEFEFFSVPLLVPQKMGTFEKSNKNCRNPTKKILLTEIEPLQLTVPLIHDY